MFSFEVFEEAWNKSDAEYKGIQLYIPISVVNGLVVTISFGNGDALSPEDIDKGYTDYIHVNSVLTIDNGNGTDGPGGDLVLTKPEACKYAKDLFGFIRDGFDIASIYPSDYGISNDLKVVIDKQEIILIRLFNI